MNRTVFTAVFFLILAFGAVANVPAMDQAVLPDELQTILAKPTDPTLLGKIDDYIASHPNDGNGFAVRCLLKVMNAERNSARNSVGTEDCSKGAALSPNSAFVHFAWGDALYDTNDFARSLDEYNAAVSLGQTDHGIFWKRCDAYRRTGDFNRAALDCDKQIALTPDYAIAHYTRGRLRVARSDYADAIKDLDFAIAADGNKMDAFYWRAFAHASLSQYTEAYADYSSAIAMGDTSPDTYFGRGQLLQILGRDSEALADLDKAASGYRAAKMSEPAAAADGLIAKIRQPATQTKPLIAQAIPDQSVAAVSFSGHEFAQLLTGLQAAFDPKDRSVHLNIQIKSASEMPAYDPQWHLVSASQNSDRTVTISLWAAQGGGPDALQQNVYRGVFLGLAASGYGGPKWEQVYQQAATADAALGAAASDPFVHRRQLAEQIYAIYASLSGKSH